MDDYYRQRIRDLVGQEDRQNRDRILTSFERFKQWLDVIGELVGIAIDLYKIFTFVRRVFGY